MRAATFGGDAGLDDVGLRKAVALKGMVGVYDKCFVSPALRARQTAEALGLDAVEDPRLRDMDYGRWAGLKLPQVMLKEPRKLVSWMKNPGSAPHGGESVVDLMNRVSGWLSEPGRATGHTVVVTHSAVVRAAIVLVIEAGLQSFWRVDVVPLAKADFRTNGKRWVFRSLAELVPENEAEPVSTVP